MNIADHVYSEPRHVGYYLNGFDPEWVAEDARHRRFVMLEVTRGAHIVDHSVNEYLDVLPGSGTAVGFVHVGARRLWRYPDNDGAEQARKFINRCRDLNFQETCDFGPILDLTGDPIDQSSTPAFIIGFRRAIENAFVHLSPMQRTTLVKLSTYQLDVFPDDVDWQELGPPFLWIDEPVLAGEDWNGNMPPPWPFDPDQRWTQFAAGRPVLWSFTRNGVPLNVREHPDPRLEVVAALGPEAAWRYAGEDKPAPAAPVNPQPLSYGPAEQLAAKHGIDLSAIRGSGKNGRVLIKDVNAAIAADTASPAPIQEGEPADNPPQPTEVEAPPIDF